MAANYHNSGKALHLDTARNVMPTKKYSLALIGQERSDGLIQFKLNKKYIRTTKPSKPTYGKRSQPRRIDRW